MRLRLALSLAALLAGAAAHAQTTLTPGTPVGGTLAAGDAHAYTLALGADQFVAGTVHQASTDAVVTVTGPDGETVAAFDETARGADPFQFQAEAAGPYTLTVTPFEDEPGAYTLTVERVEPLAATPGGRVDQMMIARDRDDAPGALVAVLDGGDVVFQNAYGLANLTHGVPMTLETRTNIGSTSKQFTAFAVALLADRGELSLDDDVRDYIPELPDLGETVTLRHLLTHTSGYREFLNTLLVAGRRLDEGDFIDRSEVIGIIQRQPDLQNAPGAEWNYNNSGFALLALVVERVSGQDFPTWMAENVFTPLGMDHTVVRASPSTLVPHSAQGYVPAEDGGWKEARDLSGAVGAGSIYSTVGDLARWMRNYETADLGRRDVVDAMTTRYVLTTGDTTAYGLGLFVDEVGGTRRVHHGGADAAHRSAFVLFPEIDAGVLVLTNSPANVDAFAARVAEAFFEDRFPGAPEAEAGGGPDAADIDPAVFDDYAGRYALDVAPDFVLAFRRGDDGGYLIEPTGQPATGIVPTSDSTFASTIVEASVTFHRDVDGVVRSLTLHQNGHHRATRLDVEPLAEGTPLDLGDFAGRYLSDELETVYRLAVEDDTLVARHRRQPEPTALRHTTGDTFILEGTGGITLAFERDAAGAVTGFTVDAGRARGIHFDRAD